MPPIPERPGRGEPGGDSLRKKIGRDVLDAEFGRSFPILPILVGALGTVLLLKSGLFEPIEAVSAPRHFNIQEVNVTLREEARNALRRRANRQRRNRGEEPPCNEVLREVVQEIVERTIEALIAKAEKTFGASDGTEELRYSPDAFCGDERVQLREPSRYATD
jgi:hypothetical protein